MNKNQKSKIQETFICKVNFSNVGRNDFFVRNGFLVEFECKKHFLLIQEKCSKVGHSKIISTNEDTLCLISRILQYTKTWRTWTGHVGGSKNIRVVNDTI